jgi:DNA primase
VNTQAELKMRRLQADEIAIARLDEQSLAEQQRLRAMDEDLMHRLQALREGGA